MESRRRKKQISAACHYAYTRLALNYYMYYEVILEGDLLSSRLERLSKRYHGLLKDFLEGSLELEELNGLRDDTASAMEANTAYTDVFQAYEYVLNRLEGRFEPQLMGNRNVRPDEEEWTAEIMAYIMDTDEPMVVNERVQSVVGQLPIRLTRNKFFAMVEEGMSVYKGGPVSGLDDMLYILRSEAMLVRSQRHLAPLLLNQRGHWGAIRPERWERMADWLVANGYAAPPSTPMTSSPSEVGRITLERVTFRYLEQSKRPVLDEVSASFDRSRITVLTGPSGCGKSTLLYLAAGIYPQNAGFLQEGTVRVEGQEPAALGPGERCALVGMLFQNPELQFCMDTVENELFFCLENRRVPRAEMEERLSAALDFCGIAHLRRRPLRSLSGGEKQRAALACLAALRPAWILLDEPFANLDDQTAALLCGQLARLHRECGTGILAIDHRLDHWLSIADEIRLMAQDGTLDGAA